MASYRRLGLIVAAAIFLADQFIKFAVAGPLGLVAEAQEIELLPIFSLTRVHNYGVSLGMLIAESDAMRWALVAFTAAIAGGVAVWLWREKSRPDALALGLVLGGALGNIVDRIRFGYVLDFADLHFGDFRPFLVFNVADAAITFGVVILLARALLVREKKPVSETDHA